MVELLKRKREEHTGLLFTTSVKRRQNALIGPLLVL